MVLISNENPLFQQLKEIDWVINGRIDNIMRLVRAPNDLMLEARVTVVNLRDNKYFIQSSIWTNEGERLAVYFHITQKYKVLGDLARIIGGELESYLSDLTNNEGIKEIRERYKA